MGRKLTYKGLKKKAWDTFSLYIRLEKANKKGIVACYTCGTKKHYKEIQAGHFKHGKLNFDKRNIHPQCIHCNKYLSGRLDVYATNLVRDYGSGILEQLDKDAGRDSVHIYTWEELMKIYEKYKELNKPLYEKLTK